MYKILQIASSVDFTLCLLVNLTTFACCFAVHGCFENIKTFSKASLGKTISQTAWI